MSEIYEYFIQECIKADVTSIETSVFAACVCVNIRTQAFCGPPQRETLIIALTLALFMRYGNPQPSKWWRLNVVDTNLMEVCLSYVTQMNVNNRHTVAVLFDSSSSAWEPYNNAFVRHIINSTNLLIISNKDQMPGSATRAAMMAKNFTLDKFHHRLGRVRMFFLEISSLSSLHDKLWFIARPKSVFNTRECFIVWWHPRNDLEARKSKNKPIDSNHQNKDTSAYLQTFLRKAFSILWHFYIFNAIIVTCQNGWEANDDSAAVPANCRVFSWFPYRKSSRCGANRQNFIEVDRCELVNENNRRMFYANYLNGGRKRIYGNESNLDVAKDSSGNRNNVMVWMPSESYSANDSDLSKCNQGSDCRNTYNVHNYFKWQPHGVLEFRNNNAKDDRRGSLKYPDLMAVGSDIPVFVILERTLRHFYNKIPSDLNGCPIRTVLIIWPPLVTTVSSSFIGMEHKMFLDVARLMNFKLEEIFVIRRTQGPHKFTSDLVKNYDADLAFGNLFPSIERYQVMDHSIGYFYDHINWVVPLAGDQPVWLNLIHCFGPELWILVVTVAAIFIILYARICQLIANESFSTAVLDCVMFAIAAGKQSLPRNGTIRIILIIWIIYSFHINLMYQVQLMSVLTRPVREKQISTPSEIIDRGLQFGFSENFAVHLQRMNDTQSKYFIKNNHLCNFETCINEMHKRPFATIGNRMYVQYAIAFNRKGTKIYTFPEPIAKSFVQAYMKKGFPLRDQWDYLIRRMIEIGYLAGSQNFYKFLIRNVTVDVGVHYRENMFLSLEHFIGAFIVLGAGSTAATVALIIEMLLSKIHSRNKD